MQFGGGTSTTTPQLSQEQLNDIAQTTQFKGETLLPAIKAGINTTIGTYNQGAPGVENAAQNLASVGSQAQQTFGGVGESALRTGITGMESLFSPDYEANQIAAAMAPAQRAARAMAVRRALTGMKKGGSADSAKIAKLEKFAGVSAGDVVVDIGANDATSLKAYTTPGLTRIGIDPTGEKFRQYYPDDIKLVPDFFSSANFRKFGTKQAKVITSIAMFYDLEDPIWFAKEIAQCLAPDGVWHFEQSYMPSMLRMTSYDTICHEHVEYYSLGVVKKILEAALLRLRHSLTQNEMHSRVW